MSAAIQVRALADPDRDWAIQLLQKQWGSTRMVSRGVLYDLAQFPGFVARHGDQLAGLVTYRLDGEACEVMSLDSTIEKMGVGSALMTAVQAAARAAGCRRVWLLTTNDNLHALRFYQKRGFTIAAVHVNALEVSRRIKPEIPLIGIDGIPLRDEIELEFLFQEGVS
jgi:DNA-3-methyladenine glycosylase I